MFRKLKPKRPVVIRNGNTVKVCHFYRGTKTCLGPLCYWLRIGKCPIHDKLVKRRSK